MLEDIPRPWLAEYPYSIAAEIDEDRPPSLSHFFLGAVERFEDRVAFRNMGRSLTYAELKTVSEHFGAWLQSIGIRKGDRVALMMPNCLQYPICVFGSHRVGATITPVNPLYTSHELRHQLSDSGARVLVVLENFASEAQEAIEEMETPPEYVVVTGLGDLLSFPKGPIVNFVVRHIKKMVPSFSLPDAIAMSEVLEVGRRNTLDPCELGPEDLAFLQYTGGTTGVSKGAMLSHGNMVANVMQATQWIAPLIRERPEVMVTALPLYHIFALTANMLVFFGIGSESLLITNPRDMPAFIKELKKHRFTVMTGVNTLFNALLQQPDFRKLDFSDFSFTLGGGMAVQRSVAEEWQEVTKRPLLEAYGLTETSPAVCINPANIQEFSGSIGLPIPSTDIQICGEDGNPLPINEVGELCVRGPQVMVGYWQRPAETSEVMLPGGWLRTGDIARMDDQGFAYIEDRKKDMILVSGFNVYPNEIEAVAVSHPDVVEAAAIGIQHERSGEAVKLFVVVREDSNLREEALAEYLAERLTNYKRPRAYDFRKELPKSNVGKILRRLLREEAETE